MPLKASIVFLSLFAAASMTYALPGGPLTCPQKSGFAPMTSLQDVETVSLQTFENRFLFPDFAAMNGMTPAQLEKTVSGLGAFYCGGEGGGATLVMRDNLLVLDAHTFFKTDNSGKCIGKLSDDELSKCQYRTIDGNGKIGDVPYYINPKSLRVGKWCEKQDVVSEDWAVVELKRPVSGSRHCDIFDVSTRGGRRSNDYTDLKSMNVFVVSAFNSTFRNKNELVNKPTVCSSSMSYFEAEMDSNNNVRYLQAAGCKNGRGNSGGAVIVPQANRCALVGFMTQGMTLTNFNTHATIDGIGGPLIEGPLANFLQSCRDHCPDN